MKGVIIKTENIERVYITGPVKTYALKDISVEIYEGEFVAIMGPSGSGKSTLLHQLGLLDTPTNGKITIDDNDIINLSDAKKTQFRLDKLGYVFQSYNLIPELTALENVYITDMARGLGKEKYEKKAKDILEAVGLGNRIDHYPSELSGGQQQRVSIARALVNEPKILFADEPTANLDTDSSKEVIDLFRKFNKEIGQTIVMVTHEEEEGLKADRIIWVKDGLLDKDKIK
ncbi:ABC transporter ATP-binding protein [Methanococcoides burtonii]|uniref:ABC transporter, ATPase subunit n=1 Tax=Methanococcoides burtonii (strain DSM 6242 / NBRC 107633 / OCM 468 / ACE-M) TaxID=259564 RepID=Q12XI2_METBU|nr:ABC transporter ATP-binding protein [Methanococcoides burtonii]ABE51844.1 ABC transporter, ATPase subunit [Methanococcoides burtonii DSM 6242]